MKPQFTIRDWLWFVPMALLFIHAIAAERSIKRLRDKLTQIEIRTPFIERNAEHGSKLSEALYRRVRRIEDDPSVQHLQGLVADHQRRLDAEAIPPQEAAK